MNWSDRRPIEDYEYPEPDDDDDDEYDTVACPSCGAEVFEDADYCPRCDNYITSNATSPWSGRPVWWIVLGAIGVILTMLALLPLL